VVQQSQQFHGDRRLMAQLFENLFRNAVEHAGADCIVSIGALSSGFYVAADGPGIPATLREKAVEADFSTRGTQGLGLAIVQSVARAHGGDLRITDAESGGARFEFTGLEIRPAADTE
jgi:signal transduction histidine kinase